MMDFSSSSVEIELGDQRISDDCKNDSLHLIDSSRKSILARMWEWENLALYAQYAAVGLLDGTTGISYNFCVYYFDGSSNLCANSYNIQSLAWRYRIVTQ